MLMAIFVAMLAFACATVVALRARHDLQLSRLGARKVQRQLAVQGAVNHLLSMLRRGQGTEFTQATPLVLNLGQVQAVKVWSFQDPSVPDVLHIQAEHLGSVSTKSLVVKPPRESVVYFEDNNQLYSREPAALGWTQLPPHPPTVFDQTGASGNLPGGEVQDIQANHDGKLLVEVYEGPNLTRQDQSGLTGWQQAVSIFDSESQTWTTVPPLPDFRFSGGTLQLETDFQPIMLDGATDDQVYSLTTGGLAIFDLNTGSWSYQTRPAGEKGRFAAAGGDQFVVQMGHQPSGSYWLSKYEAGNWSVISVPDEHLIPRGIDEEGKLYADHNGATKVWDGENWQTLSPPPQLAGYTLRAVDAEGALVFGTPSGQVARWDLDTQVEEYMIPSGTDLYYSDWRQLGGGGQITPGALPGLEVVSSY